MFCIRLISRLLGITFWCYFMGKLVTVTAKIPKELKEKLEALGVNVSGLIRRVLEGEVKRLELERLRRLIVEASEVLREVPSEELVRAVRESRDER